MGINCIKNDTYIIKNFVVSKMILIFDYNKELAATVLIRHKDYENYSKIQ